MSFALLSIVGGAQVICYVEAPSANEGNYEFTYAEPGTWGVADLTDPLNSVSGEMVFVDDGTAGDSLGCNGLINGVDVNGKVAVLYRGSCEFGTKALNAQNAGAIAVIIINNLAGSPVAMGAGADGGSVTIPVVMITDQSGALLRPEIIAGGSTVFIGSKNGLYGDDLGMTKADVLRAPSFSNVQLLSQNGSEFSYQVGAWVRNYGSNNQTGVTLTYNVDLGATNMYNETSAPVDIDAGDSAFISLPDFTQSSYANGYYEGVYTINMGPTDESDFDNMRIADFVMSDTTFGYSKANPTTLEPLNTTNQFNGSTGSLTGCLVFRDANASRIAMTGMYFSAGTSQNPDPTSIDGEYVEVFVYEWLDVFTDINDPGFAISNLNEVGHAEYIYTSDAQSENVYAVLDDGPLVLTDNQRYLFCLTTYSPAVYPGYDTDIDYNWNVETYLQPVTPVEVDGTWYGLGYGTDRAPSMYARVMDANSIGIVELTPQEIQVYPNPASDFINVPLQPQEGEVQMTIVDINGKIVSTQNVSMEGNMLKVDVTTLPSGTYVLNLTYENGTQQHVNVVVTR